MENILQQFLDAGMLPIDNYATFNFVQMAAQGVAKDLTKDRAKLVPATLVARETGE